MMLTRKRETALRRFEKTDCVVVIAGGGLLPVELASHFSLAGQKAVIFRIEGEAFETGRFAGLPCEDFRLEDFPHLLSRLKRHDARLVTMAGSIERRPRLSDLSWSPSLLRLAPGLFRAIMRGDDGLLRHIVRLIEKAGIAVAGAHEFLPDVVTGPGCQTARRPGGRDLADINAAFAAALAIGALDIGQAAVAIGGRAIALEGIEGTDGLLERTISLRRHGRLAGARGGVLAKCAKPQQELRADLPAIGPRTVVDAMAAGLAGIALEAGRTLILDRQETLRLADEKGIFIVGVEPDKESR